MASLPGAQQIIAVHLPSDSPSEDAQAGLNDHPQSSLWTKCWSILETVADMLWSDPNIPDRYSEALVKTVATFGSLLPVNSVDISREAITSPETPLAPSFYVHTREFVVCVKILLTVGTNSFRLGHPFNSPSLSVVSEQFASLQTAPSTSAFDEGKPGFVSLPPTSAVLQSCFGLDADYWVLFQQSGLLPFRRGSEDEGVGVSFEESRKSERTALLADYPAAESFPKGLLSLECSYATQSLPSGEEWRRKAQYRISGMSKRTTQQQSQSQSPGDPQHIAELFVLKDLQLAEQQQRQRTLKDEQQRAAPGACEGRQGDASRYSTDCPQFVSLFKVGTGRLPSRTLMGAVVPEVEAFDDDYNQVPSMPFLFGGWTDGCVNNVMFTRLPFQELQFLMRVQQLQIVLLNSVLLVCSSSLNQPVAWTFNGVGDANHSSLRPFEATAFSRFRLY